MYDQFDIFVEDLLMEKSNRIIVIICASKIDDLLLATLEKYFIDKRSGKKDDLLDGDQPLSTLSARIKTTYRLGIIDYSFFCLLEQLRAIRNKSAHNVAFDIEKSPFKEHITNIRKGLITRRSYNLTKFRYFQNKLICSTKELQCLLLTLCVILQAVKEKTVRTIESGETIRISKK